MALQNRVDPFGALRSTQERGAWMGNRGVLHDASKRVVAAWRLQRWITCVLCWKGRRREVFAPNRWSELFFLDEATALSAGHRPCAEFGRSLLAREAPSAGFARSSCLTERAGLGMIRLSLRGYFGVGVGVGVVLRRSSLP